MPYIQSRRRLVLGSLAITGLVPASAAAAAALGKLASTAANKDTSDDWMNTQASLAASQRFVMTKTAAQSLTANMAPFGFLLASVQDGGIFLRDPTDTNSAENGGAAAGTIIRGADYATAGVFKRQFSGAYNARWFGAVGDNSSGQYAALEACRAAAVASGINSMLIEPGIYNIDANEWVISTPNFNLYAVGAEIRGSGNYQVTFASVGGAGQPATVNPTSLYVIGLTARSVAPFGNSPTRAAIRVSASYSTFVNMGAVTSADVGGNGILLEADNTGSGPYYNSFVNAKAQGPQNGAATGRGICVGQRARTAAATRYANTNTFTGGRAGGYFVNVEIAGSGNRFIGMASENSAGYGTAFKWISPVANSNVQNQVLSPYIENADVAFDVAATANSPSVEGRPYISGVTKRISDTAGRLLYSGDDGIRALRLPASPTPAAPRSGVFLGNTANADSQTLDWYEEGSFSPYMQGSVSQGGGTTMTLQVGRYTRIGNMMFVTMTLAWSASVETGNIQINMNDIPYPVANLPNTNCVLSCRPSNMTWTPAKPMGALTLVNTRLINIEQYDPLGGAVSGIPVDPAASVMISGHYYV